MRGAQIIRMPKPHPNRWRAWASIDGQVVHLDFFWTRDAALRSAAIYEECVAVTADDLEPMSRDS